MSKLMLVLLLLLQMYVEIDGAPLATDTAPLITCPPPTGKCYWRPEDTCTDHSECYVQPIPNWVSMCCPDVCEGYKVCTEFRIPAPPTTTTRPTTEHITTTHFTTQPASTVENQIISTPQPTNAPSTKAEQRTSIAPSTNVPTTDAPWSTTEQSSSTTVPSTTESRTTLQPERTTTMLSTKDLETTTKRTTTKAPTTTQTPTTAATPTTTLPPSTATPTTQKPTSDSSICGRSDPKNILFIVDGTVNYRQYWVTRANEFKKLKHFLKGVISELKGDKYRIGVMQYGGGREPRMEVGFREGLNTAEMMYDVDGMKQMGGRKGFTGEALAVANNKFYELNSLEERSNAQDIIVLITRAKPSDKGQAYAEAEMLKRRMVRIVTIGISPYPKYLAKHLQNIASFKQDELYSKYSDLANRKTEVLEKICLPVTLPGSRELCRNKQYDVHFVVDGSRSINHFNFAKKQKFLRDVFFLLESPSSDLNIGLMQFSTLAKTEELLELQKHSLNEELHVIENMEYQSGRRTMLGDALSRVNKRVFNGRGGDRGAIENVLVIFSDGRAHDVKTAYRQADNLKERNVRVIAMAANERNYVSENMKKLATDPKDTLSVDLDNSAYFAKQIVSMICETNA